MAESTVLRRVRSLGFTLIELMVAMSLGLLVVGGVSALYLRTSQTRQDLDRVSNAHENARYAFDQLAEDLRHAGFYGPFVLSHEPTFSAPSPCATALANLGWNTAVSPPQVPAAVAGLNDPTTLPTAWNCLPQAVNAAGFDVIAIRRVAEGTVAPAAITTTDVPYVQASACPTETTKLVVATNGTSLTLRNVGCTAAAAARQYLTRIYYVASCNVCSPSDGIRTLKRIELRNGALALDAIAEGIAGLQFQYGFDTDGNGSADTFLSQPNGTAGSPANEWSNVTEVRASVLVQSVDSVSGPSMTRTFDLGPDFEAVGCAAGRRCTLAAGSTRLMNVAGPREMP